ncbi:hypothetical protein AMQ83_13830 [Paenibacillus riograndensis]|nr:hypothetical protein AMQ83_13830 [Paenibacillus riograndensis]
MIKLKISDANDNSDFIRILFEIIHEVRQDIYWGVGDLEIIPRFSGDYPGSGHHKHTEIAYNFGEKVERERIAFVTTSQLIKVINDAL